MKKLILLLLITTSVYSQTWEFSILQDPKMLLKGISETDNDPALNVISRITFVAADMPNTKIKPTLNASFEYADLNQTFQRYSIGPGFRFNLNEWLTVEPLYNLGIISRGTDYSRVNNPKYNYFSSSVEVVVRFRIFKGFYITVLPQFTQRTDYYFYKSAGIKSGKWIYSNFGGVTFKF